RGGGAAPLEMPQDGDTHIGMAHPAQLGGYHFTNTSQSGHTAQVALSLVNGLATEWHAALCHDHQAKLRPAVVALPDLVGDYVQRVRDLWEEDHIGPTRHAGRSCRILRAARGSSLFCGRGARPMPSLAHTRKTGDRAVLHVYPRVWALKHSRSSG